MIMLIKVLLPIFLIFLTGYIGQKVFSLHIKSISTTALYLMTPPLIFKSFYTAKLDSTYLNIVLYSVLLLTLLLLFIKLAAYLRGYNSSQTSSLILSSAFMNNGNFGAPVILFAYGQTAFQYSIVIMILHTILMSTVGLYFAAKGNFNVKESLYSVLKMPIMHALILGLVWQYFKLPMPENIYSAISMVGDASIPLIMLVLGMQLAEIKLINIKWDINIAGIVTRLLISPAIAYGITLVLPIEPLLAKTMIILAAMPSAVIMVMYAIQYDNNPELVSSITLLSTLLSLVSLSVLLTIL